MNLVLLVELMSRHSLARAAEVFFAVGIAMFLEQFLTIAWTYPYCLNQVDGPAYAALGMPLPYLMRDGATSLGYYFMPHAYMVNVALMSAGVFFLTRHALNRTAHPRTKLTPALLGAFGALLVIVHLSLLAFVISIGSYRPVALIELEGYLRYTELRPVAVVIRYYGSDALPCSPSRFWFKQRSGQ